MPKAQMTSRERLLTTIRHEEPDRVPISPRTGAYLVWKCGSATVMDHELAAFPQMDHMWINLGGTPNYVVEYPDEYDLPEVRVEERRYSEGEYEVVERAFHTPAGKLRDRTKIPPAGREFGVLPDPIKTEWLVKSRDDLPALRYLLAPLDSEWASARTEMELLGDRGVVMACVRSALDHQAGDARNMQDLMMDYYDDRAFFDELVDIFHQHSLRLIRSALNAGVEWIFGSWYFTSVSSGWSPQIFQEAFVPLIREHVALTHGLGGYYDYYDDGNLARTLPLIAACGPDVVETCTPPPVGDFDLAEAKASVGSLTALKGYVDLLYVMKHGTPELVDRTVREAMAIAKPGGGFIIGTSDSFREGTPPENLDAYFRACLEYGAYA